MGIFGGDVETLRGKQGGFGMWRAQGVLSGMWKSLGGNRDFFWDVQSSGHPFWDVKNLRGKQGFFWDMENLQAKLRFFRGCGKFSRETGIFFFGDVQSSDNPTWNVENLLI